MVLQSMEVAVFNSTIYFSLSHLQSKYDDKKEPVGRQHQSALLQGPAVSEERDDEDEAADSDEDVGGVVQHGGVGEFLQDVLRLGIALKILQS